MLKILNDHNHDSEAALIEANVAITNMKQRAKDTLEPTSSVINECTSGISQAAKVHNFYFWLDIYSIVYNL